MTSTTNLIFTSYVVVEKSAIIEYHGKKLGKMTQIPVFFAQNENVPQLTDF